MSSEPVLNSNTAIQISVQFQEVSNLEENKLAKIFKLSANRSRQYQLVEVEANADIIITANPELKPQQATPFVVIGAPTEGSKAIGFIKPPLISIRVLKTLDALEFDAAANQALHQDPAETLQADGLQAYNVLVVDDSVLIHKALQLELEKAEFNSHIDYAESGEECLAKITDKQYDLIFLDVMMPGIDGYDTCGEIRKNAAFKKTPVIMLSARTSPLDEVKGVIAGCTTYLTKPIKHDDFQKMLQRMDKWLTEKQ